MALSLDVIRDAVKVSLEEQGVLSRIRVRVARA
jgi:hypothetical protein